MKHIYSISSGSSICITKKQARTVPASPGVSGMSMTALLFHVNPKFTLCPLFRDSKINIKSASLSPD